MEYPMMPQEINGERIRKEEIEGETFYCVVDIVAELLDAESVPKVIIINSRIN